MVPKYQTVHLVHVATGRNSCPAHSAMGCSAMKICWHAGMPAEEGEALGDLGIPRRQRGSRRRLSFDRMTHEPVYERPRSIERHTSGIYDLIDAIGLLGMAPCHPPCRREMRKGNHSSCWSSCNILLCRRWRVSACTVHWRASECRPEGQPTVCCSLPEGASWNVQMPRACRLPCRMSQMGRAGAAARASTSTLRGCLRYPALDATAPCAMPAPRQVSQPWSTSTICPSVKYLCAIRCKTWRQYHSNGAGKSNRIYIRFEASAVVTLVIKVQGCLYLGDMQHAEQVPCALQCKQLQAFSDRLSVDKEDGVGTDSGMRI